MSAAVRTAIVTGAARGIGLAIARLLGGQGIRVAMVDRDSDALQEAVQTVPGAVLAPFDISQQGQVDECKGRTVIRLIACAYMTP